jgi:hypothetical protein
MQTKRKSSASSVTVLIIILCLCVVVVLFFQRGSKPAEQNSSSSTPQEALATITEGPSPTPGPTNTPAPTFTFTPAPAGESRNNPFPGGTPIDIGGSMVLTIVGATRPADDIVRNANMFNSEPESGQEYLLVEIQVICTKDPSDKCNFSTYEIKAVNSDGIVLEDESFLDVEGMLKSSEFFGGATLKGKMFFLVPIDDKGVVLFYEPFLIGDLIYMALP